MKIAVLMGSPRKKDSFRVCKLIEEHFSHISHVEFDYLYLKNLNIVDCRGCDQCFQKSEHCCPCKDDLDMVKQVLLQADGIIFSSPVYACQITGLMKRTLDRFSYLFHRQEFVGKPAITVITTAGGGLKPAGNYLKMTACGWGCHLVGEISIVSPMFFKSKNTNTIWGYREKYHTQKMSHIKRISLNFELAIGNSMLPVPTFYDIFMFQCLRSKTYTSKADYEFWNQRGWMDRCYYYEVKLNPVKKIWGRLLKAYVDSMAKRLLSSVLTR